MATYYSSPTPEQPEGPVAQHVVDAGAGDADGQEQEVGDGQVEDQQVGGVSHLVVLDHLCIECGASVGVF